MVYSDNPFPPIRSKSYENSRTHNIGASSLEFESQWHSLNETLWVCTNRLKNSCQRIFRLLFFLSVILYVGLFCGKIYDRGKFINPPTLNQYRKQISDTENLLVRLGITVGLLLLVNFTVRGVTIFTIIVLSISVSLLLYLVQIKNQSGGQGRKAELSEFGSQIYQDDIFDEYENKIIERLDILFEWLLDEVTVFGQNQSGGQGRKSELSEFRIQRYQKVTFDEYAKDKIKQGVKVILGQVAVFSRLCPCRLMKKSENRISLILSQNLFHYGTFIINQFKKRMSFAEILSVFFDEQIFKTFLDITDGPAFGILVKQTITEVTEPTMNQLLGSAINFMVRLRVQYIDFEEVKPSSLRIPRYINILQYGTFEISQFRKQMNPAEMAEMFLNVMVMLFYLNMLLYVRKQIGLEICPLYLNKIKEELVFIYENILTWLFGKSAIFISPITLVVYIFIALLNAKIFNGKIIHSINFVKEFMCSLKMVIYGTHLMIICVTIFIFWGYKQLAHSDERIYTRDDTAGDTSRDIVLIDKYYCQIFYDLLIKIFSIGILKHLFELINICYILAAGQLKTTSELTKGAINLLCRPATLLGKLIVYSRLIFYELVIVYIMHIVVVLAVLSVHFASLLQDQWNYNSEFERRILVGSNWNPLQCGTLNYFKKQMTFAEIFKIFLDVIEMLLYLVLVYNIDGNVFGIPMNQPTTNFNQMPIHNSGLEIILAVQYKLDIEPGNLNMGYMNCGTFAFQLFGTFRAQSIGVPAGMIDLAQVEEEESPIIVVVTCGGRKLELEPRGVVIDFIFGISSIVFVLGITFFIMCKIGMVENINFVANTVFFIGIIIICVLEGLSVNVTISLTLIVRDEKLEPGAELSPNHLVYDNKLCIIEKILIVLILKSILCGIVLRSTPLARASVLLCDVINESFIDATGNYQPPQQDEINYMYGNFRVVSFSIYQTYDTNPYLYNTTVLSNYGYYGLQNHYYQTQAHTINPYSGGIMSKNYFYLFSDMKIIILILLLCMEYSFGNNGYYPVNGIEPEIGFDNIKDERVGALEMLLKLEINYEIDMRQIVLIFVSCIFVLLYDKYLGILYEIASAYNRRSCDAVTILIGLILYYTLCGILELIIVIRNKYFEEMLFGTNLLLQEICVLLLFYPFGIRREGEKEAEYCIVLFQISILTLISTILTLLYDILKLLSYISFRNGYECSIIKQLLLCVRICMVINKLVLNFIDKEIAGEEEAKNYYEGSNTISYALTHRVLLFIFFIF